MFTRHRHALLPPPPLQLGVAMLLKSPVLTMMPLAPGPQEDDNDDATRVLKAKTAATSSGALKAKTTMTALLTQTHTCTVSRWAASINTTSTCATSTPAASRMLR